ncbi:MAG: Dyp-type peroxidase [Halioglobus sp.]
MSTHSQLSILPSPSRVARYFSFSVTPGAEPSVTREAVASLSVDENIAIGVGEPLLAFWGGTVDGLRTFPALSGPGVQAPSTQQALWCWLRGDDQGDVVNRGITLVESLGSGFTVEEIVDGFKYGSRPKGKDLTGYEDGTENPAGDAAEIAAFVSDGNPGLDGSSFVAVQQWQHDLTRFRAMSQSHQDNIIGRRIADNKEIENAPASAHVKRTEQESFTPQAFLLRRSMPFAGAGGQGLHFVAFGHSLDAFEVQLRRMVGLEDGVTDGLFEFSQATSGAYYWCPPVSDGRLDLSGAEMK